MILLKNIISRVKKRRVAVGVVVAVSIIIIIDVEFLNNFPQENISCHYVYNNDGLKPIEKFYPGSRSIFFLETSCKETLSSREACSIESAVRAHPEWNIYVAFSGPITSDKLDSDNFKILKNYRNLNFARIHIMEYSKGTPVESIISSGALNDSKWKVKHTSDVLRYLTLYKYGGVYMDLDMIVVMSISSLARNWAARESEQAVSAGIFAFSRDSVGRSVAESAIRDISANYKYNDWCNNGPGVMARVLKERCSTADAGAMSAATCEGFEIYGPQFFYPIEWRNARKYFIPGELNEQNAYTYHTWGHISKDFKVVKGSPYERLANRYCPAIYKFYDGQFDL